MTNLEAIQKLSPELLTKFIDQVFVTGYNAGHQSLVDVSIDDTNPFDEAWLGEEVKDEQLVIDGEGEAIILAPLAQLLIKMAEFEFEEEEPYLKWEPQIIIPGNTEE